MFPALLVVLVVAATEQPPVDLPVCPTTEEKPDVKPLVLRTERVLEGKSSIAVMRMAIKTKDTSREVKMKLWSRGRDFTLIRVLDGGAREVGMMTLKREKQLWNYLPQAGRVMKLPSGMMGDSWMGSDFTNDDLVRGSSLANDFEARVDKVGEQDGRKAWFITLTPRAGAQSVWGKVELVIDRESCVPLEQRFFDEDQVLARRMQFAELKKLGWRTFPMKVTVIPADGVRQTTITYESMEFDSEIPDDTFSLRRLQQGKE